MTKPQSNSLTARFSGELALIEESMAPRIDAAMCELAAHEHSRELMADTAGAAAGFWPEPDSWKAAFRPYIVENGVLQIPVKGVLLHNFPWAFGSWATGYLYIQRAIERGCEDFKAGNIKGIAFLSDSGGGFVAGLYDMLDKAGPMIREAGVPVRAFVQNSAYSAAYATITLASSSPDGRIVINKVGGAGSIGTLATHIDWTGFNERMGLKYTFIHAGECKVDGSPDLPLSERARKRIQSRVNELNELFVATVAQARGIPEQTIRNFEAATFTASESLSNGLADEIGSLDDALAAFAADLSSTTGDETMSKPTDESATVTAAALETATATARAEGVTEGASNERTLIFAILDSAEAQKRPAAARALAAEGGRTLEQAIAFLAKLPEEQPAQVKPGEGEEQQEQRGVDFQEAMERTPNPDVGASGGQGGGQGGGDDDDGSDTVALVRQAGLTGFTAPEKR